VDGLWEPDGGATGAEPPFSVVWRGYDRRQVDEAVRAMQASPGKYIDEVFPDGPLFDVVFRGYDRHEVEGYFARFRR
jgi:hypothetical protein